jgi:transcriptional regulator with XRE-family HTH domain
MSRIPPTPGGNRLRTLREACGRTQLDVELDASLGTGYLQRVESGKVRYPERDTLERILTALGARYSDRRSVLELFGYVVDAPLPTEADVRWAIDACAVEMNQAAFPVYLLDCAHRLLAWNALLPRLFRLERGLPGTSMLKIIFDPAYGVTPLIANGEVFFPAQIRALRHEMSLFGSEPWYGALIEDMRRLPLFEEYWSRAQTAHPYHLAGRPFTPLELRLKDGARLQFRLLSEPFSQDRRFRVIYYLPADAITIERCATWSVTPPAARPSP